MRKAKELLAALASHGVEVGLAAGGRLIVRGRAPRPTALLAEARKQAKALAELLRRRATISPPKEEVSERPPKEVISGSVAAEPPHFPRKIEVVQPCSQSENAGRSGAWESAVAIVGAGVPAAAGASETRATAGGGQGHRGVPVLSIEATCPACLRPGALAAWPWSSGLTFCYCRGGCKDAEVFRCLDKLAKREDGASFVREARFDTKKEVFSWPVFHAIQKGGGTGCSLLVWMAAEKR
jgi:hypothetical protein